MELANATLDVLLRDMDAADRLYRPTQFWRDATKEMANELRGTNLNRFRSLPGPLSFFVPTYSFPSYGIDSNRFAPVHQALASLQLSDARYAIHLERLLSGEALAESDYRVLLASDVPVAPFLDRFSESNVGEPIEQFEFDGRNFGRASLNYLLGLAFLKRHCDLSGIRTVLEIGGGFGSLGEILLADPRNNHFYIDIDIPPTLHCARHYLAAIHGDKAILNYAATREHSTLDIAAMQSNYRAATLASWQIPKLRGHVDLFVNFISFQEMEPDVVRNYLSEVDRLGTRLVLLRNIREGKAKATTSSVGVIEPIFGDMYDDFLGNYRLIAANTVPFGHRTVDSFHSELRLYERR
jgi:putative sugar O-methyltransferase